MATSATPTTPTTVLQAVNTLLRSIGKTAVASLLTADLSADASQAIDVIGQTAMEVEAQGWHHNTEDDLPLDPSPDGTITLPANVHKLIMTGYSRGLNLSQRDGKLYDLDKHTFTIGQTVYVKATFVLPFESIPQAFRWWITVKSARRFATQKNPTSASFQFTKVDEDEAAALAKETDVATEDRTLPEANPHFQGMRRR